MEAKVDFLKLSRCRRPDLADRYHSPINKSSLYIVSLSLMMCVSQTTAYYLLDPLLEAGSLA
jgi:hypothetical protein